MWNARIPCQSERLLVLVPTIFDPCGFSILLMSGIIAQANQQTFNVKQRLEKASRGFEAYIDFFRSGGIKC